MEVDGEDSSRPQQQNNNGDVAAGAAAAVAEETDMSTYILHAVLVHSGDNHGGHYVVFINPRGDGKWCKFDDDVVSRCTENEAIKNNFGGNDDEVGARQSTNAYMLVYIRKSALKEVLCEVRETDIPEAMADRLNEEKKLEIARRKEKSEAHLYMNIRILVEDDFVGHQGNDLYDPDKVVYKEVRVKKADSLREVIEQLSQQFKYDPEHLRIWPLNHRTNQTLRPSLIDGDSEMEKTIIEVADSVSPWTIFLEMSSPADSGVPRPLQNFDKDHDVMLFLKYYDPAQEKIHYMGHMYISITAKVSTLVAELAKRAHLPEDTSLLLYEEIKPNMLERIEDMDKPLEHVLEELMDGDIVVYQVDIADDAMDCPYRLPFCKDYFRDLFYKVDITFVDKNTPTDPGFTLTLSQRMTYNQFAAAAAQKLDMDANKLQFFKTQNYRDIAGNALRCTYEGTLKELLIYSRPKHPKKLYYQKLSIPIHDLENKKQVKCLWLSPDGKEKEVILYPNKSGTVADLLEEARAQAHELSSSDARLRLLDITSHKIAGVIEPDTRIDGLAAASGSKTYRLEEIPRDQG